MSRHRRHLASERFLLQRRNPCRLLRRRRVVRFTGKKFVEIRFSAYGERYGVTEGVQALCQFFRTAEKIKQKVCRRIVAETERCLADFRRCHAGGSLCSAYRRPRKEIIFRKENSFIHPFFIRFQKKKSGGEGFERRTEGKPFVRAVGGGFSGFTVKKENADLYAVFALDTGKLCSQTRLSGCSGRSRRPAGGRKRPLRSAIL